MKGSTRTRQAVRGIAGAIGLLVIAEAVGRVGLIDQEVVPLASTVLGKVGELVTDPEFGTAAGVTFRDWMAGWAAAVAVAIPAGVLLGISPRIRAATRPVLEFLRPLPSVVLAPLALLLLHHDEGAKIAVVAYAAAWPVLINTMYGVREVDPVPVDTVRVFGFGRPAVLCWVALPTAAPFIVTGMRLACSIALIVTVAIELLSVGSTGVGAFIGSVGASGGDTALVLAATLCTGVAGLVSDVLIQAAQRRLLPWDTGRYRTAAP